MRPLHLCSTHSPLLKHFLIFVALLSTGSYYILGPRSYHLFHCLVSFFSLLCLTRDSQMQNCLHPAPSSKCVLWPAGLSSPAFGSFWEKQNLGLHSRLTASPSAFLTRSLQDSYVYYSLRSTCQFDTSSRVSNRYWKLHVFQVPCGTSPCVLCPSLLSFLCSWNKSAWDPLQVLYLVILSSSHGSCSFPGCDFWSLRSWQHKYHLLSESSQTTPTKVRL